MSGGFAGVVRGVDLVAAELTAVEHRALERALEPGEAAGAAAARAGQARDLLVYELFLDTGVGERHLVFDELNAPAALSGFITRLADRARPIRP